MRNVCKEGWRTGIDCFAAFFLFDESGIDRQSGEESKEMDEAFKSALKEAGADVETTVRRFMGNEAMYEKFLKKLLDNPNFDNLKVNMADKDYEEAYRNAHTCGTRKTRKWMWRAPRRRGERCRRFISAFTTLSAPTNDRPGQRSARERCVWRRTERKLWRLDG